MIYEFLFEVWVHKFLCQVRLHILNLENVKDESYKSFINLSIDYPQRKLKFLSGIVLLDFMKSFINLSKINDSREKVLWQNFMRRVLISIIVLWELRYIVYNSNYVR
jgi:hypothetical protein